MSDADDLRAWLRLTLADGIGIETQQKLLTAFGLPQAVFSAGRARAAEVIGKRADLLFDYDDETAIEAAITWAKEPGHHLISLADPRYPPCLLQTADPPTLLYVRGCLDILQHAGLAVVGSRNATPQGIKTAESFSKSLAACGIPIISGLALGIDAAAHRGALEAHDGQTIAVVGTGIDRLYPARNKELAQKIIERGVIVSEFPLGTPAIAANFPRRNRIISGLSQGVLVVEAATESGSLITARLAGEQGRDVFAIPGSIHSPVSRGCHQLIKQGAKLVETAEDILEEWEWKTRTGTGEKTGSPEISSVVNKIQNPEHAALLEKMGYAPCGLDDLIERSTQSAAVLLPILLELELSGQIAALSGSVYQRI